ncbi:MAG: methionine--tRNA ligase [bacterium]|nr:methionine--tRNA ligase [bacterium]
MSKSYITTAIPYVNAKPHIGFALELVQADVIARAHKEAGDDVRFLTGTDENSIKNVQAAEKAGVPIQQFVDENANVFFKLTQSLNIGADYFIRTTEERHKKGAQKFWEACKKDIFQKEYEGLYCTGCETFYLEKELENGLCPEHKTQPEPVHEKNYFFKLSDYSKFLLDAFENNKIRIHPKSRQNEVLNFIKEGLEDFSISRSNERAKNWGIPVPGDDSQMMYVWFDALTNYINALGYGSGDEALFEKYWNAPDAEVLHVIGKGIMRFHAIYWPAMLESAGIFPKNGIDIMVHGYVTVNGQKISKSIGNTVDPFELVEKYGADAVRYFLLREIPATEDGDFSEEKFIQRYNSDLANGLGNLVSRVATLAEKSGIANLGRSDETFTKPMEDAERRINVGLVDYQLHMALSVLWELVMLGNQYIDEQKPWSKSGDDTESILANLSRLILRIRRLSRRFLPDIYKEIDKQFGIADDTLTIDRNVKLRVHKGKPLFPRI